MFCVENASYFYHMKYLKCNKEENLKWISQQQIVVGIWGYLVAGIIIKGICLCRLSNVITNYQCFLYSRIDNVFMDFSLCSSHPELLNLVARKSGVKPGNVLLEKFANKESRVLVQENVRVRKWITLFTEFKPKIH